MSKNTAVPDIAASGELDVFFRNARKTHMRIMCSHIVTRQSCVPWAKDRTSSVCIKMAGKFR